MTEGISLALGALLLGATVLLLSFGLHGALVAALGLLRRRTSRADAAEREREREPGLPRIAVVIVAHDEERVISRSVASLVGQRHAKDRFSVFVVADRCTDRTATLAEGAGARVLDRRSGAEGKAAAVAFAVQAVRGIPGAGAFDAIAIFDADNVADPDFLQHVGHRLAGGARVVQGFVDAANPSASWVSGSSALGFWAIAALVQEPRERLGLSSPLMGTGFALLLDDAVRLLTDAGSLTDDVELGARLALEDIRVAYEPTARVLDEKPARLDTAIAQRHRWMQGRWSVAGRYLPLLLGRALARDTPARSRLRLVDVAIQLVAPSLSFTAVATVMVGGTALGLGAVLPPAFARVALLVPPEASIGAGLALYALPALAIARFHPPARVWLYYAVQPFYLALSAPLALSGFLTRSSRTWRRTPKG